MVSAASATAICRTSIGSSRDRQGHVSHHGGGTRRWVGELLADVTKSDARQLTSMLKAFRSNWEGRE